MYDWKKGLARWMPRADGTGGGAQPPDAPEQTGGETATTDEKTYTQADLDAAIARTLAKERAKAERLVAAARTEGERLARMTADEREQAERMVREDALTAREAEVTRRELRVTAQGELAKRGLPAALADVLHYADADACSASIAAVEQAFRSAVQTGMEARLRNPDIPKAGHLSPEAAYLAQVRMAAGL